MIEGDAATVDLKPETEVFQLPTPTGSSNKVTPGAITPGNTGERVLLQPPICCYTYGQPRVGNRAFSRLYKQRVPHTFRVATEGDPFTAMPHLMCCAGIYKHAGKITLLPAWLSLPLFERLIQYNVAVFIFYSKNRVGSCP